MKEHLRVNPIGTSFSGGIAVVLVYWIYLALVSRPPLEETGIAITIFLSAMISQYIPLKVLETRLKKEHG